MTPEGTFGGGVCYGEIDDRTKDEVISDAVIRDLGTCDRRGTSSKGGVARDARYYYIININTL